MRLRDYQARAAATDHIEGAPDDLLVPLLGLAGETGSLLTEYKKVLRDRDSYRLFKDHFAEEIGDVLWYLASVSRRAGLKLEQIAADNLEKVRQRWPVRGRHERERRSVLLDDPYPRRERLPRRFRIALREEEVKGRKQGIALFKGKRLGDALTDNSHEDDAYRFHDVFHYAHAAVLGWSPVLRRLMKRKRKSDSRIDEVEDGARANVTEEAVSAMVFEHARAHRFYEGIREIDFRLLRTVKEITSHLEVRRASFLDWERAILAGYRVWRTVRKHHGGVVIANLRRRTLRFAGRA